MGLTEAQITRAVIAHWRARGVPGSLVASIPNQRAAGQYGLTRGVFDLLVIAPSLPIGLLELKTEKGKLSPYQQAFKATLISAGAPYAIAYGLDQAIEVLETWRAIKPAKVAA